MRSSIRLGPAALLWEVLGGDSEQVRGEAVAEIEASCLRAFARAPKVISALQSLQDHHACHKACSCD